MDIKNWKKEYREKYEGANVWSSRAIDSQIEDIDQLLQEKDKGFVQDLESARKAISYQPISIASEMICNLYNKYSPQEDKQ